MYERARQCLAKLALEPEWESQFEANSYGFRPARSAHDAIDAIFNGIRFKAKFVLDADLKACFDHINQETLLNKLHTYTAMKHAVKGWLKAGVLEDGVFAPTEAGTPQGGLCKALHKDPYAKQVTMQRDTRKALIFVPIQLNSFA